MAGKPGVPHPWNLGKMKKGLERTAVPTMLDIAWAAGIYEGEGTANGYAGRKRPHILATQVRIGQKNPWILHRCKELFGGHISTSINNSPLNTDRLPITMYTWQISGARARGFLMTIYKFLSPRRKEQAKKALGLV